MRRYNELSALWRAAIFQKSFYQDVAQNWRGIGLRYLLLLLVITWLLVLIPATVAINSYLHNEAPADLKDFPAFRIEKGIVTSDVPQPYVIADTDKTPVFVLDTTGATKLPSDLRAKMLLTRTEFIQEDPPGNIQRLPLASFPDKTIDQAYLLDWIRLLRNLCIPVGLVAGIVFSLGWRIIFGLLLALLGRVFNARLGGGLTYGTLLRLSLITMTLPILLGTILLFIPLPAAFSSLVFLIQFASIPCLARAVKAAAVVPNVAQVAPPNPNFNLPPHPSRLSQQPPPPYEKPGADLFP